MSTEQHVGRRSSREKAEHRKCASCDQRVFTEGKAKVSGWQLRRAGAVLNKCAQNSTGFTWQQPLTSSPPPRPQDVADEIGVVLCDDCSNMNTGDIPKALF